MSSQKTEIPPPSSLLPYLGEHAWLLTSAIQISNRWLNAGSAKRATSYKFILPHTSTNLYRNFSLKVTSNTFFFPPDTCIYDPLKLRMRKIKSTIFFYICIKILIAKTSKREYYRKVHHFHLNDKSSCLQCGENEF